MTEHFSHDNDTRRPTAIVQVPPSWRQRIVAVLQRASLFETVEVRERISTETVHPSREQDFLAERALSLAAEAAYRSGSTGCGVACGETSECLTVMFAVHDDRGTDLYCRTVAKAEADEFLSSLSELCRTALSGNVPPSETERLSLPRERLLADDVRESRLWRLGEDGRFVPVQTPGVTGVLSGSFHPLHSGHRNMRDAAREVLGQTVLYEMTLQNADKPPLDWLTLHLRSRQFNAGDLLLTHVPKFSEKAELLPGTAFVVGWDTAARVLERRFYPGGELESSLEKLAERECRFLVAARRDADRLRTLEELTIPGRYRDLFSAIPPELFEEDVSSTAIREAWLSGESETGPPGLFTDFFENQSFQKRS